MINEIYRARVLIGREVGGFAVEQCPECGRNSGEEHAPGCSLEQCPSCRMMLIGCSCNCLCPYETEKIIASLYCRITSMEDALAALESGAEANLAGNSFLVHATMRFLFDNMPANRRAELETLFLQQHPELVPHLYDDDGHRYYTAEQLAEALNMPIEKVRKQIDAMVAAGRGVRDASGVRVKMLH